MRFANDMILLTLALWFAGCGAQPETPSTGPQPTPSSSTNEQAAISPQETPQVAQPPASVYETPESA